MVHEYRSSPSLRSSLLQGELDQENGPLAGVIFHADRPLVVFDNTIGDREAQTRSRANFFCRKEGVKDTLLKPDRNAGAAIAETDFQQIVLLRAGNGDSFARHFGHSIAGIGQ